MEMETRIKKRSEQDPASCWSVEDLFAGVEAWEAEFAACQGLPEELAAYRGRLGESAGTLLAYLELSEAVDRRVGALQSYTSLRRDEEIGRASCRERV